MIERIIWDFNGTLVDDLKIGVDIVNSFLKEAGLLAISKEEYKKKMKFPIIKFYEDIGLKNEDFHRYAQKFYQYYLEEIKSVQIKEGILPVLECCKQENIEQYLVSASEDQTLHAIVQNLKIDHYFKKIQGLENRNATGKIQLIKNLNLTHFASTLFIGDTYHDFELASSVNAPSLLVSWGHQCESKLQETKQPLISHPLEIISFLKNFSK